MVFAFNSQAQVRTWEGSGKSDDWSNNNNWSGNALPAASDDVIFAGSLSSGTSIDTVADRIINSLAIDTLRGFSLGNRNNELTLISGVLSRNDLVGTEANQSIISPVILGANGIWTINGSGILTIDSEIQDGAANSFSLEKAGSGTLVLSGGAEVYHGNTLVNGGALVLGADNQIPDGASFGNLVVNSGGAFDLADFSETINGLSGGGVIDKTTGTNNETLTVGGNDANGDFSGVIQNTDTNDLLNLTKTGAGTQILSGNNTYRGSTTLSAGTLRATTHANALGAGALSLGGGTLELANDTGLAFNRNTTVSANTTINSDVLTTGGVGVTHSLGTLSIGAQTLTIGKGSNVGSGTAGIAFGDLALTGNATFSVSLGAQLTLEAIVSGSASRAITFGGAGNISVTGIIDDASGAKGNTTIVTKTGAGTLDLTSANTYTGNTTVSAGLLLVNNATGSATGSGEVFVDSNAVLGGSGTIAPSGVNGINVTGVLKPGGNNNTGNLTFNLVNTTGKVVMNNAASVEFKLGLPGVAINSIGVSDLISLAGATAGDFAFNGNIIDFLGTGAIGYYKIFDTDSDNKNTWTGLVSDASTGLVSSGLSYTNISGGLTGDFIVGTADNGGATGDLYIHIIPEPSAALLGGISVLFLLRRRRVTCVFGMPS